MFSFLLKKAAFVVVPLILAGLLFASCDNDPGTGVNAQQPSISTQPSGGTFDVGTVETFPLTVTANITDGGTLSYQWYSNMTNSTSGGTEVGTDSATLTLNKTDYTSNVTMYYFVVVTNTISDNGDGGKKNADITSDVVTVIVDGVGGTYLNAQQPNITAQPAATTPWNVSTTNSINLTVTASVTDGGTLGYLWYSNTSNSTTGGIAITSGGTSATLTLAKSSYTTNDNYYFYVIVTNTNNSVDGNKTTSITSTVATVTVSGNGGGESGLSITTQPQGGTVNITSAVTLNLNVVAANPNTGTLSYQWYSNTTNSNTGGTVISGKTSDTLTISNTDYTTNRTFYFYVVVTNATSSETVTSNAATVTITGSTTTTYFPWDAEFETHMDFFAEGIWLSYDGYHIHKWSDFDSDHYDRAKELFSGIADDQNDLKTYSSQYHPQNGDYILMYDDDAMGMAAGGYGMAYMGLVRAVNISTADSDEGAFIIEYFEGTDPAWLWDPDVSYGYQGLDQGSVPFFGFYYEKVDEDEVCFGNTSVQAELSTGNPYYVETATLEESINKINSANKDLYVYTPLSDFGSWHRYDCDEWLPVEGW